MALRVLLADESSTIKKVFQLALQDYAVDVRPVNVGVDVFGVAQNFKPDIIFADVLLQKKSGYDVSAEIKQDPGLQGIPVVLMWSGFMELDEDKMQASHADAKLEKPFDVAALRKLVADLVPRTKDQRLSQFLNFPKMPDIQEPAAPAAAEQPATKAAKLEEDFKQISIPKMKGAQDKFRVNVSPEDLNPDEVPVTYQMPAENPAAEDAFLGAGEGEDEEFSIRDTKKTPAVPTPKTPSKPATPAAAAPAEMMANDFGQDLEVELPPAREVIEDEVELTQPSIRLDQLTGLPAGTLTEAQLEKIIRAQSAEIIESVVWKVIPDLAAQIIERELNKLLKEKESNPY